MRGGKRNIPKRGLLKSEPEISLMQNDLSTGVMPFYLETVTCHAMDSAVRSFWNQVSLAKTHYCSICGIYSVYFIYFLPYPNIIQNTFSSEQACIYKNNSSRVAVSPDKALFLYCTAIVISLTLPLHA